MSKNSINYSEFRNNDGGYYAIKGFAFQIDKAILEILIANDDEKVIALEQIQDINTDDYVMQVKYKETQNYSPSRICQPVFQLITEFLKNKNKKYYLYCYFRDQEPASKNLNLQEILNDFCLD